MVSKLRILQFSTMPNKLLFLITTLTIGLVLVGHSQTCDTTDIAYNKPVNVSSNTQWHTGDQVVDRNPTSTWQAVSGSGDTAYLYVDLQQSFTICKVKIDWGNNGKAKNYKIDVSSNAVNWTSIDSVTNNSSNSNTRTVNGTGRYVRISMTLRYYNWASYEIANVIINNSIPANSAPTTSITSPSNGTQFYEANNLNISANATDADGSISKVEFYSGTTKIGEDLSSPFTLVWSNLQVGTYSLTTKAYDNDNAVTTSSAVSITVNPSNRWALTGNAATSTGFLGTTNSQRLIFKTNNIEKMTILEKWTCGNRYLCSSCY